MKNFLCTLLLALLVTFISKSFGQSQYSEKELNYNSTYLSLSKLKYNDERLICHIENNKPYSGKAAGWLVLCGSFTIANICNFGLSFYGIEGNIHNIREDTREFFLLGKIKRGKEINTWYYYTKDGILGVKAHFKKGLLNGKAKMYYKNGKIERVEEYKSGKLDGKVIKYDENGNITRSILYKKGNLVKYLIEKD